MLHDKFAKNLRKVLFPHPLLKLSQADELLLISAVIILRPGSSTRTVHRINLHPVIPNQSHSNRPGLGFQ